MFVVDQLRAAGVLIEKRRALPGHSNGDLTTHYSAAEISELIEASEKIVNTDVAQTPTLTLVRNGNQKCVGKTRGLSSYLLRSPRRLVGRPRLERGTNWLKANCSTD
jgi:hypothetical protein